METRDGPTLRRRPHLTLALLVGLLVLLQVASAVFGFPGLAAIASDLVQLSRTGLWRHLGLSYLRVVISVMIAGTVGIGLGYTGHRLGIVETFLNSVIFPVLESMPSLAWTVICVLLFGISQLNVIFIVSVVLLQYFVVNTLAGISSIDPKLVEMGDSFASYERTVDRYIKAPMIAQYVFPSIRIAYGVGWKVIVLAEMFGARNGIGYLMNQGYSVLDLTRVLSLSLLVVALFLPSERFLGWAAQNVFRRWQQLGQGSTPLAQSNRISQHNPGSICSSGLLLRLERVSKSFDGQSVLSSISLTLHRNEIVCILGPTGCGKTTLLRLAAGLLDPDEEDGSVSYGTTRNGQATIDKGFVFQEPRLLPWRTVRENIQLPFLLKGCPVDGGHIERLIALLELADYAESSVDKLSGGMQQRVAIARALALDPPILILDEPFKGLDILSRERAEDRVLELYHKTGKAVLFVTHDIDESIRVGDRILVLSEKPARIGRRIDLREMADKPRDPYSEELIPHKGEIWNYLHNRGNSSAQSTQYAEPASAITSKADEV